MPDIAEMKAARRARWLFWPFAAISAALAFRIANGNFTDSDLAGNALASAFAILLAWSWASCWPSCLCSSRS